MYLVFWLCNYFILKQWETIYEDDFSAPEPEPEPESDDSDFEFDGVRTKKISKRKKEKEKKEKVRYISYSSLKFKIICIEAIHSLFSDCWTDYFIKNKKYKQKQIFS